MHLHQRLTSNEVHIMHILFFLYLYTLASDQLFRTCIQLFAHKQINVTTLPVMKDRIERSTFLPLYQVARNTTLIQTLNQRSHISIHQLVTQLNDADVPKPFEFQFRFQQHILWRCLYSIKRNIYYNHF